ncbi:hypothetical protein [Sphingomonas japonica]|uniref:Protein TonB n=1 Tax=Sphingomonas japonica TaxID=511662 RepID=A0ABX0U184_9SPHN|nr:hypothetical protein [Sphingomonas japonica]NIJ24323.1 protein TonB [Sphingomonas japonica]
MSAGLALALGLLMFLGLLTLGIMPELRTDAEAVLTAFDVDLPAPKAERAPAAARPKSAPPPAAERPERPPEPPPPPRPPTEYTLPGVIPMARADFAAADIGKIASAPADAPSAGRGLADESGARGVGTAPDGSTLFAADWQREPTDAELAMYMPKRSRAGWGLIACRTAPRNRVTDCRILDETPGSGIARGMREAAWQFLVLPPRIDGQPVMGAWVRIRFDLNRGIAR